MNRLIIVLWMCFTGLALAATGVPLAGITSAGETGATPQTPAKPRVIISTDIGGTDPDDFQSMIHYLMVADRFRTEGLISSPYGHGRKEHILKMIDLYEKDLPGLSAHSDFPEADELRAVVKQGATEMAPGRGWSSATEGSDWIIRQALKQDEQPLWVLVWGGLEDLAQALHDAPQIAPRIRVYWIGGPNKKWSRNAYHYLAAHFPDLWMIEANSTYRGWFMDEGEAPDLTNAGYYERYIRDRGAMGTDFVKYYRGEIKMGDSPSVAYLMSGDPEDPAGESWGGSFAALPYSAVRRYSDHTSTGDRVPTYALMEWTFQVTQLSWAEKDPVIWMEIDGQRIDGTYNGNGIFQVRFVPKIDKEWSYTVHASAEELEGTAGGFTSVNPWPGDPHPDNLPLNGWYSDRIDPGLYVDNYQGAGSVSQWRESFLSDWAERWRWLETGQGTGGMPPSVEDVKGEPIRFTGNTYADKHFYDGRLRYAVGVHNYQAFRANRSHPPEAAGEKVGWTYSHQPYLAYWNGRYYLQYLSNVHSEHIPPGRTLISSSTDGFHWGPPQVVFPPYSLPEIDRTFESVGEVYLPEGTYAVMHQRMGFYVAPNGRLLTSGFYGFAIPPDYYGPNKGPGLGRVVREIYEDGTFGPIYFIRYNRLAGWDESNTIYPLYTESGDQGFREACESLLADRLMTLQWQEEDMYDPDFYAFDAGETFSAFIWTQRPDGSYLGLMKGNISALSEDGVHWTEPGRIPTFHTTSAKMWVERTSDGRYALVYNHSGNRSNRFPAVVLTSEDAYEFDKPLLLNGEVPPMRYMGFEKNSGSQYFRGIAPGNGDPPGEYLWNTYSMNKEDIWVSRTTLPIRGTVDQHVDQDFEGLERGVAGLEWWNLYVPRWAPLSIGNDPVRPGNRVLSMEDEEPYDYVIAQRAFPESTGQVTVEFELYVEKAGNAALWVEVQDRHGTRPTALRFDGVNAGMDRGRVEPSPVPYPAGMWKTVRMELDLQKQEYGLYIDGEKIHQLPFEEKVASLERLVFRTGPWRGDVRQFIVDGEPGAKGIYKEDLPGADSKVDGSVFLIDKVRSYPQLPQ